MVFDSVSALMNMSGHGPYVWFSYGVSALVLLGIALEPGRRRRDIERRIRAQMRREGAQTTLES